MATGCWTANGTLGRAGDAGVAPTVPMVISLRPGTGGSLLSLRVASESRRSRGSDGRGRVSGSKPRLIQTEALDPGERCAECPGARGAGALPAHAAVQGGPGDRLAR